MPNEYKTLSLNGLWHNNPALVQLLGLCPLLGVSNSTVNAMGLALATLFVITASNTLVSALRHKVPTSVRLPIFVMVIATLTICTELLMQAFAYELYLILGIFIPLIVTNCVILGRAEAYASRNPVSLAFWDGLMNGIGFGLILILIGALREMLGAGTLFADMNLLFGDSITWSGWVLPDSLPRMIFFALPPGAFVLTGLLIALKKSIDLRRTRQTTPVKSGHKRVRTTGTIS